MARRRRSEAPMPVSSAGLVRFFEEEIKGIRIRPELVLFMSVALVVSVILAHLIGIAP